MSPDHHHPARLIEACVVITNTEVAPGQFRMHLRAPGLASMASPGQFCMLEVTESLYPFLRRPMCFERILPDGFQILYKVEGSGTALLSRMIPGQRVSVQGPLGNGFPIDDGFQRHLIVAGGIGVAPFPALAEALVNRLGVRPEILLAARTSSMMLCTQEFRDLGCSVAIATDDGSAGLTGYASDLLEQARPDATCRVYACGPMIMMRAVSRVALAAGASCLVSLEAQMACGDGACLGCVIESTREIEGERMVRVCFDGPVFDTRDIDWDAHNQAYDL